MHFWAGSYSHYHYGHTLKTTTTTKLVFDSLHLANKSTSLENAVNKNKTKQKTNKQKNHQSLLAHDYLESNHEFRKFSYIQGWLLERQQMGHKTITKVCQVLQCCLHIDNSPQLWGHTDSNSQGLWMAFYVDLDCNHQLQIDRRNVDYGNTLIITVRARGWLCYVDLDCNRQL